MRLLFALCVGLVAVASDANQGPDKGKIPPRYGISADTMKYPQDTPEKTLGSVVKALENSEHEYLVAQLVEPKFVDARVAGFAKKISGKVDEVSKNTLAFQQMVTATKDRFLEDPTRFKELARFAKDGEFMADAKIAVVTLKTVPVRKVFLRNSEGRWFMEDREK